MQLTQIKRRTLIMASLAVLWSLPSSAGVTLGVHSGHGHIGYSVGVHTGYRHGVGIGYSHHFEHRPTHYYSDDDGYSSHHHTDTIRPQHQTRPAPHGRMPQRPQIPLYPFPPQH